VTCFSAAATSSRSEHSVARPNPFQELLLPLGQLRRARELPGNLKGRPEPNSNLARFLEELGLPSSRCSAQLDNLLRAAPPLLDVAAPVDMGPRASEVVKAAKIE